jgi:hypothetical protein
LCRERVADRVAECGFPFIRIEPFPAIGNLSGAIKNDHRREGVDGEETIEAIGKDDRGARFFLLEIGRD